MIALLTNPPALNVDLLEFSKPRPPPLFPALIWKLHTIIASPASRAEDVKIAKRALLDAIGESKQSSLAGAARRPSLRPQVDAKHPPRLGQDNNIASGALAKLRRYHETDQN